MRWISRRLCLLALALGTTAQNATAQAPAPLVFAINEGVTYRVSNDEIRAKYRGLSDDLGKLLKRPVQIEPVGDYPTLKQGLAERRYDMAFVHPAHISIRAIRESQYQLIALTKGFTEYRVSFMVKANSPLRSLADLKGKRLYLPDQDSITSWMARATLRDTVGAAEAVTISYTRYQDAVPFMVEHGFSESGGSAANAVVKQWTEGGGKVLSQSRPVPIKHIIASPSLSPADAKAVREYLLGMDSSARGREILEQIKYRGFLGFDEPAMLSLGKWLGV